MLKPSMKATGLVNRFAVAVEDLAFKGSAHPDAHDEIDARYEIARSELLEYLAVVEDAARRRRDD